MRILLSHFQLRELQRCYKQAGGYISPGHYVADTGLQIVSRFSSNFEANLMLSSSLVRLKRTGDFKWIEIVISLLVLSSKCIWDEIFYYLIRKSFQNDEKWRLFYCDSTFGCRVIQDDL